MRFTYSDYIPILAVIPPYFVVNTQHKSIFQSYKLILLLFLPLIFNKIKLLRQSEDCLLFYPQPSFANGRVDV